MLKYESKELRGHITLVVIISAMILFGLGVKIGSILYPIP